MIRLFAYIALAIFLVLYGLLAVSNIRVQFMDVICGLAALTAGILFGVLAVRDTPA
jgi:hypothetical protein